MQTKLSIITSAVLQIVLGILLIVIPASDILNFIFIILGIIIILFNLPVLLSGIAHYQDSVSDKVAFFSSLISIIFGFVMVFYHSQILAIVVACWLIIIPVIRIILANDKSNQLKAELGRIVLGLVLLLFGPWQALEIILDIAGYVLIVLAVLYVIFAFISIHKAKKSSDMHKDYIDAEL